MPKKSHDLYSLVFVRKAKIMSCIVAAVLAR